MRLIRRSPASAAATVLTLSLTLGAGASVFAVVDAILLTPPPFADPDTLATLLETREADPAAPARPVLYATFAAWRDRAGPRAALEAFDGTNLTLTGIGSTERVQAANVTPGFLRLLGTSPARGRHFEDAEFGRPVVVVSDAFWRGKLSSDPDAVGRTLMLGSQPHTIVGVLPSDFLFGVTAVDIWRPLPVAASQAAQTGNRFLVMARLAPGTTASDLAAALNDVSRRSTPPSRVVVTPVATAITGAASRTLAMLAGAVAFALLIAFANLGGLLTVRAIDRRRELAVRSALGARRGQIARHLLLEAQALVVMGIAGGILLAVWLTPLVARIALEQFGGLANRPVAMSWRAIGTVALVAIGLAFICGALPAAMAARRSAVDVLRRGLTPLPRELSVRRAFVVGEIALAFVLLVSVLLVGRSLFAALAVDPGFDPRGPVTMAVSLPGAAYPDANRVVSFYSTLQTALDARLGSGAVGVVDELPLTGDGGRRLVRRTPVDGGVEAVTRSASEQYFDVMRIPVLDGRSFDARDDASAPVRVIVSRSLSERLFRGESAVGRQVYFGFPPQPADVVGVSGDVKHGSLDESTIPTMYLSLRQAPSNSTRLVVRSAMPLAAAAAAVREEVARLDRELPVYGVTSMADVVARSRGVPVRRMLTATFSGFAILAIVLSGIGLMGIVAHDVALRRTELALRLALGADPRRLLGSTYWQGAVVLGAGLIAGGFLSIWTTRALGAAVVLRGGLDPMSVAAAIAMLAAVCAFAIFPIARRASRTDPALALRGEP